MCVELPQSQIGFWGSLWAMTNHLSKSRRGNEKAKTVNSALIL